MRLNVHEGTASWSEPFTSSVADVQRTDPPANQVNHFAAVIRGEAQPICSARDGLRTPKFVDAVVEATRTGQLVRITYRLGAATTCCAAQGVDRSRFAQSTDTDPGETRREGREVTPPAVVGRASRAPSPCVRHPVRGAGAVDA